MKRKRVTADTIPTDMPKNIRKYWYRRYDMFRRFDEGIKLSNEMWFSVTPEAVAL
jgi:trimethylguanosine synthase